ncbi:DUF6879 family protein [Streptomyces sp. HNM0574]|uniref:DUF6879 family protein n=1 Tax=Streptomyces sp. HNM0574 TaxID=2714954 RepID=UPI00146F1C4C|nr:DUF6879 family protein [Streptomyces sp. HNM0574]NLU67742.1 hypothetical protein [Streptomyces sp. HNM0574]
METAPTLEDRLRACQRSAIHLEMRDWYMPSDPRFAAWRAGDRTVGTADAWLRLVADVAGSGVRLRRARVVSEPVSEYISFEHHLTTSNVKAGEDVRWLPRRQASDLALPGNDFWLLDGELAVFHYFDGDGEPAPDGDEEAVEDPAVVKLCAAAFESVWQRAVPHADYQPPTL